MFGITRAPELDRPGLHWFNTDHPLGLSELRGRIVVLDFWTFCCINCLHVLPILRRVEETFPTEVVVIGIHSPKFSAERDPANLAQAIERYDIRHPVIHDPDKTLWRDYAVRAWPTLAFLSPDGYVLGQISGEPKGDDLIDGLRGMVEEFRDQGELRPYSFPLRQPAQADGGLRFPGKIKPAPDPAQKLWAVADSGHHRITLFDDHGQAVQDFGSGLEGAQDGPADQARFRAPQGLICTAEAIFVADTGNHAIRRIDRISGEVSTLAGLGGRGPILRQVEPVATANLASPWDLELLGRWLFFANAGTHQIGIFDLDAASIRPVAGTGGEAIVDGEALAALLAQPSGLSLDAENRRLYFTDSETSAIRVLHLGIEDRVETLVGAGLFDFGDQDGPLAQARLQHPLGLCHADGKIFVADSYNNALRVIDLTEGRVSHLGEDFTCDDPICLPLAEPAGIIADGPERLLVCDTNNHRILEYHLGERRYRSWAA